MDNYNDFINQLEHKLKIKFVGNKTNEYLYSNWEIAKITNSFNEIYYKNELLQNIKQLITNGVDPKDILIVNNSINIDKKYTRYRNGYLSLSENDSLELLYYLGSPTPFYTNKNIMLLSEAFEALRIVYSLCNKYNLNTPDKKSTLNDLASRIYINEIKQLTNYFIELVNDKNDIKDVQLKDTVKKQIFSKLSEVNFNFIHIETMEIVENQPFPEKLLKFDRFNSIFKNFEKPIIVVVEKDRNEQRLRIICFDFLVNEKFKKENPRFLETNMISQNSPLEICLTMAITVLPTLIQIYQDRKVIYQLRKTDEINASNHENHIAYLDRELAKADNTIESLYVERRELKTEYPNFDDITSTNSNVSSNAVSSIRTLQKQISEKGQNLLEKHQLHIADVEKKEISD